MSVCHVLHTHNQCATRVLLVSKFLVTFFYSVCLYVHAHMRLCHSTSGNQRTAYRAKFFLPTVKVLGMDRTTSGLVGISGEHFQSRLLSHFSSLGKSREIPQLPQGISETRFTCP